MGRKNKKSRKNKNRNNKQDNTNNQEKVSFFIKSIHPHTHF